MIRSIHPPTRKAALARLTAFVPRTGRDYAASRNHDFGPDDHTNVSLLSPYVRHRLITEQEAVAAVLDQHSAAAAEKFIQEVVWRSYWKGWLQQRPKVWDRYLADVAALQGATSPELLHRINGAEIGSTGIACFDAWARELVDTGYLHNHARMWFASVWIFTLKLPWQLGADFFMRHLLDGDAASNTLSWRWIGGLHTLGKTYLARPDNIAAFSNGRFATHFELATVATPLPRDDVGPPYPLPDLPSTPPPGPCVLIITDDDLGIETWPIAWNDVQAVLLLDTAESYTGVDVAVAAFKRAALADTAARTKTRVPPGVPVATRGVADAIAALLTAADRAPVVMYEMPIGPTRTAVAPLQVACEQRGNALHRLRRPWDAVIWPHATAGFFKVKDKIPTIFRSLGMST